MALVASSFNCRRATWRLARRRKRALGASSSKKPVYTATDWELLGAYCPDGNRGFGRAHFFLARGALPSGPAQLDEEEALIVRTVPLSSVQELLVGGQLGELTAVAGIGLALARLQVSEPRESS